MFHGRVSPSVEIELKLVCSTRSHIRACDWLCGTSQCTPLIGTRPSIRACDLAVLHKSVYPIVLTRPSIWLGTRACGWPCDPSQYVCPIFTRPESQACLEPCEVHGLFTRVYDPCMFEIFVSFQNFCMISV
ncbi:Cell adhesion molecule 3 [Gossypium arboreum]|uniref:Cell adhesion molecule 3 n=1 Tax=Gossypium arboreum TaxID=29729 RepID=A0A0B0MS73_GOSAR|nr:Cell adhesion molecule 3 [Gossypium arboreum]